LIEPGWREIVGDCLPEILSTVWLMLLGSRLQAKLPQRNSTRHALFIATGLTLVILSLLSALFREDLAHIFQDETWTLILAAIIVLFLAITFLAFISRAMKSLEKGRNADVSEYGGEIFLWGIWLISVWIIAPRLNLLYDKYYS
jgi:hypothetical protein